MSGRFSWAVIDAASRAGAYQKQMVIPIFLNVIAQIDIGLEPEILPPGFLVHMNSGNVGVRLSLNRGLDGIERGAAADFVYDQKTDCYRITVFPHGKVDAPKGGDGSIEISLPAKAAVQMGIYIQDVEKAKERKRHDDQEVGS